MVWNFDGILGGDYAWGVVCKCGGSWSDIMNIVEFGGGWVGWGLASVDGFELNWGMIWK